MLDNAIVPIALETRFKLPMIWKAGFALLELFTGVVRETVEPPWNAAEDSVNAAIAAPAAAWVSCPPVLIVAAPPTVPAPVRLPPEAAVTAPPSVPPTDNAPPLLIVVKPETLTVPAILLPAPLTPSELPRLRTV